MGGGGRISARKNNISRGLEVFPLPIKRKRKMDRYWRFRREGNFVAKHTSLYQGKGGEVFVLF